MGKFFINASPAMRLATRLRKMYGLSNKEAIRTAKKIENSLNPRVMDKLLGATKENRTYILQRNLENSTTPAQRALLLLTHKDKPWRIVNNKLSPGPKRIII